MRPIFRYISLGTLGAAAIAASFFFQPRARDEKTLMLAPPPNIEHLTFGFAPAMADSLWIRTIQDFSFCEKEVAKHVCTNDGWVSHMLLAISYLDPSFRTAMTIGPLMLTVIVNDMAGASKVFDRAVELFPTDWHILYGASYHAMVEEKNLYKAGLLYRRAAENGAPNWVYALASRLLTQTGQVQAAKNLLSELRKQKGFPEVVMKRIEARLDERAKATAATK